MHVSSHLGTLFGWFEVLQISIQPFGKIAKMVDAKWYPCFVKPYYLYSNKWKEYTNTIFNHQNLLFCLQVCVPTIHARMAVLVHRCRTIPTSFAAHVNLVGLGPTVTHVSSNFISCKFISFGVAFSLKHQKPV